jgi:hypothetical protein
MKDAADHGVAAAGIRRATQALLGEAADADQKRWLQQSDHLAEVGEARFLDRGHLRGGKPVGC